MHHRRGCTARASLAEAGAAGLRGTARTPLLYSTGLATTLTPRELDVVMLAVDHTSAQIADRLDLAVSTVNNVLARVYTKLGIGGRPELRTLLADRDAPAEPPGPRVLG